MFNIKDVLEDVKTAKTDELKKMYIDSCMVNAQLNLDNQKLLLALSYAEESNNEAKAMRVDEYFADIDNMRRPELMRIAKQMNINPGKLRKNQLKDIIKTCHMLPDQSLLESSWTLMLIEAVKAGATVNDELWTQDVDDLEDWIEETRGELSKEDEVDEALEEDLDAFDAEDSRR